MKFWLFLVVSGNYRIEDGIESLQSRFLLILVVSINKENDGLIDIFNLQFFMPQRNEKL